MIEDYQSPEGEEENKAAFQQEHRVSRAPRQAKERKGSMGIVSLSWCGRTPQRDLEAPNSNLNNCARKGI